MNDYLVRCGKTLLIICITLSALGIAVSLSKRPPKIIYLQDPNYVQPPCEAQRRLKEQGLYHGRIDNIWGVKTDKAYCDWAAIQTFKDEYYDNNN